MNSIIYLCIFSVIYSVQAKSGNELFKSIENLKNNVNLITSNLASYGKNLTFDYYVELSNRTIQHYEKINFTMSNTLEEFKNATKVAAAEGKDVAHCYEDAKRYLDAWRVHHERGYVACMYNSSNITISLSNKIEERFRKEHGILKYLNSFVLECSSGTTSQVVSCVADKVPVAELIVESYESLVEEYKELGDLLSTSGIIKYSECADRKLSDFHLRQRIANRDFTWCVRDTPSKFGIIPICRH